MTIDELREDADRRRHLANSSEMDDESAEIFGQEADFIERLAARLQS